MPALNAKQLFHNMIIKLSFVNRNYDHISVFVMFSMTSPEIADYYSVTCTVIPAMVQRFFSMEKNVQRLLKFG